MFTAVRKSVQVVDVEQARAHQREELLVARRA